MLTTKVPAIHFIEEPVGKFIHLPTGEQMCIKYEVKDNYYCVFTELDMYNPESGGIPDPKHLTNDITLTYRDG